MENVKLPPPQLFDFSLATSGGIAEMTMRHQRKVDSVLVYTKLGRNSEKDDGMTTMKVVYNVLCDLRTDESVASLSNLHYVPRTLPVADGDVVTWAARKWPAQEMAKANEQEIGMGRASIVLRTIYLDFTSPSTAVANRVDQSESLSLWSVVIMCTVGDIVSIAHWVFVCIRKTRQTLHNIMIQSKLDF